MTRTDVIAALRTAHPWVSAERMADLMAAARRKHPVATEFELGRVVLATLENVREEAAMDEAAVMQAARVLRMMSEAANLAESKAKRARETADEMRRRADDAWQRVRDARRRLEEVTEANADDTDVVAA